MLLHILLNLEFAGNDIWSLLSHTEPKTPSCTEQPLLSFHHVLMQGMF